MALQIEFDTDNAAFADGAAYEIRRRLREIADKIELGLTYGVIFDGNGNRIGAWVYDPPEEPEEEEV